MKDWTKEIQIALASLAVAMLTLVATVFPTEIHDFFRLPAGVPVAARWVSAVVAAIVIILGIVLSWRLPVEFPRKSLLAVQIIFLAAISIVLYETRKPPPFILVGSDNAKRSFFERIKDLSSLDPAWLDLGSGRAMAAIFQAFDYGTTLKDSRLALIALSSDGTEQLEKIYDNASPDEKRVWISVTVAKPPLGILFRPATNGELGVHTIPSQTGNFDWVDCDELVAFINSISKQVKPDVEIFPPEPGTGTRDIFERACGVPNWPDKDVPHYRTRISDYPQDGPFLAFVSSEPEDYTPERMHENHMRSAVVCKKPCSHLDPLTEHVVVMKAVREPGALAEDRLSVTNSAECYILKHLIRVGCGDLRSADKHHIVKIDLLSGESGTVIPQFLQH